MSGEGRALIQSIDVVPVDPAASSALELMWDRSLIVPVTPPKTKNAFCSSQIHQQLVKHPFRTISTDNLQIPEKRVNQKLPECAQA